MKLLRWLGKALLALFGLVLLAIVGYVAYAKIAWGDIAVEVMEAKYGGADLRVAQVDGVPMRYRLSGDGPAVVLIHNHFMDMGIWDAWADALADQFTVLRYDLSGHGLTGPDPSGRYTVARDVELLTGLLDQLQIADVALIGSSLGGNIAFTFAATHSARTRALVLVNSGGLKRAGSNSEREMPGWADAVFPLVPPAAFKKFLNWFIVDDAVITPELEQRFVNGFRRAGNRSAELARLRQYDKGAPDAMLARVQAPTLVMWGADNPQLPVDMSEEFVAKLTSTESVARKTYNGAGHVLPLERPGAASDVTAFLEQHQ